MATTDDEQALLQKWRTLPPDKQQEVLHFADFLGQHTGSKRPRRSLEALWADLHIHVTPRDMKEARKEMWRSFPRDH